MNILKTITASVAIALTSSIALTSQAVAQDHKNGAQIIPNDALSGVLIKNDGVFLNCIILGVRDGQVYYKNNFRAVQTHRKPVAGFSGIFLFDPPAYALAKKHFRDRKYKEALAQFAKTKEYYKRFKDLDNNFSDLSQYYMLECHRKLHNYAEIEKIMELFIATKLTRPSHQTQLEVYKLWSAVNNKNWARLARMTDEWRTRKVPIGIRAQIAFCEGLAHEGLENQSKALNAYATAMTADFTKSDSIVRQAALNSLRIYSKDKGVKTAIKLWKTEHEEKQKAGYIKLGEANALARVYDKAGLGAGVELPAQYKLFQKYTSDEMLERLKEKEDASKED